MKIQPGGFLCPFGRNIQTGIRGPHLHVNDAAAPYPVFPKNKETAGQNVLSRCGGYRLRRPPPRLPSMLRFKSESLPSEADINCFSLSSKEESELGPRV